MSFKNIAIITAIITLLLGVGYLFFGSLVIGRWKLQPTESVLLLGRRLGAFYLGLSVILFLARSAPVSVIRTALTAGAAVILLLLVVLGIYEFLAGHAGSGILASVVIESLLSIGYIIILIKDRRAMVMESLLNK